MIKVKNIKPEKVTMFTLALAAACPAGRYRL